MDKGQVEVSDCKLQAQDEHTTILICDLLGR